MRGEETVAILGAGSFVAAPLMQRLSAGNTPITAFSRRPAPAELPRTVFWTVPVSGQSAPAGNWISLLPIWQVPTFFPLLEQSGCARLVVLSSTSRYTKQQARYQQDRSLSHQIIAAEETIENWARHAGITCVFLQPTMIYLPGHDQNLTRIARFIRRYRFFPLVGQGSGLRQPVHAADVAQACQAVLSRNLRYSSYLLPGGEEMTFRYMVEAVFSALDLPPRFLHIPQEGLAAALNLARLVKRDLSPGMAERMNRDQVFDHRPARLDLDYAPRRLDLSGL